MQEIVRFQNVRKNYGSGSAQKEALRGLDFSVRKGELLALLGPNGAGKSTALNLLLGLRSPTSGLVEVFGGCPKDQNIRARLGATPQELSFPQTMTIHELLLFTQNHFPQKRDLQEIIELLHLTKILHRKTVGMSGGEKRKVGLAMALTSDPELLVLDEPTTGMDVEARRDLWNVIQLLLKEGRSIILTTHYLEEVETLAERVIVIDEGRALFDGTVAEIKSKVEMKKVKLSSADLQKIQKLSGILKFETKANEAVIYTKDSDQLVKDLIATGALFQDLSIELATLEEAFLQLRGKL